MALKVSVYSLCRHDGLAAPVGHKIATYHNSVGFDELRKVASRFGDKRA